MTKRREHRRCRRIESGRYEYHIDGHVYKVDRVLHGRVAGRDDISWELSLSGELITSFDLMSDAFEYLDSQHKEAREEHFGYRMLPE